MEKENKPLLPNGGYPMHTFDDVRAVYFIYISNPEDQDMIRRAYEFAKERHTGQFRRSGEPYIQHPIEVAYICARLGSGPATIASAFLHDVVEDTDTSIEEIERNFGPEVAKLVNSLTKIQRMKLSHMEAEDFEAEDHRKILLGMAQDIRVIIIKLADRLHNLRTLDSLKPERQKTLSQETLDVFVPIAHRLGINTVAAEMEDLCLKYLEPEIYAKLMDILNERFENRKSSLEAFKKRIADILLEQNIPFRMESRVKSTYSLYKKMYQKGYSIDDIYDILAIRIITKTQLNCYEILGIVHSTYKPLPGRFKDYIAMPKPNMYQSLHTSILTGEGQIFEVQIRTEEMDSVAETGVAAHWRYKEGHGYNAKEEQKEIEEQLYWFRDFVSLAGEAEGSAKEYIQTLTNDIFGANVYVFTPMGKVIDLPTGATTLDFAYKIHTRVGDTASGAIVNGQLVPLNTVLKTGDICEIRTSKSAQPNDSWLEIAKTNSAKAHIRKALQKANADILKQERARQGKASLMDSFRMQGFTEEEAIKLLDTDKMRNEYHFDDLEDLYVMVFGKNPAPNGVIDFLHIKKKPTLDFSKIKAKISKEKDNGSPFVIPGGGNSLAITKGQCCCPLPGDDVVGYITKGKGITVHRRCCPNVAHSRRLIDVSWKSELGIGTYPCNIEIFANDRPNLVSDLLQVFSAKGVGVSDLKAHLIASTNNVNIEMTVLVSSAKVLYDCFADCQGVKGVYSTNRLFH